MSILRITHFTAFDATSTELREFLERIHTLVSGSKGCSACEVLHHINSPNQFIMLSYWDLVEQPEKVLDNLPEEIITIAVTLLSGMSTGLSYNIKSSAAQG